MLVYPWHDLCDEASGMFVNDLTLDSHVIEISYNLHAVAPAMFSTPAIFLTDIIPINLHLISIIMVTLSMVHGTS